MKGSRSRAERDWNEPNDRIRVPEHTSDDEFRCPYDSCNGRLFEDIDEWLGHVKDTHGVNGPL